MPSLTYRETEVQEGREVPGLSCLLCSLVPCLQFTLLTTRHLRSFQCVHPSSELTSSGPPSPPPQRVKSGTGAPQRAPAHPHTHSNATGEAGVFHRALQVPRPPAPQARETKAFLVKGRVPPVPRGSEPPARKVSSPATSQSSARQCVAPSGVHFSDENRNDC